MTMLNNDAQVVHSVMEEVRSYFSHSVNYAFKDGRNLIHVRFDPGRFLEKKSVNHKIEFHT